MNSDLLNKDEIEKIFYTLFSKMPDAEFVQYFQSMAKFIISTYPESQKIETHIYLQKNTLFLSGIELSNRLIQPKHLICILFKLMVHAVETRPQFRGLLINRAGQSNKLLNILSTCLYGLKSLIILILVIPSVAIQKGRL